MTKDPEKFSNSEIFQYINLKSLLVGVAVASVFSIIFVIAALFLLQTYPKSIIKVIFNHSKKIHFTVEKICCRILLGVLEDSKKFLDIKNFIGETILCA